MIIRARGHRALEGLRPKKKISTQINTGYVKHILWKTPQISGVL